MKTEPIPEKKKKEGQNIDYEALNKSIKQKNRILGNNQVVHKGHNTN